MVEKFYFDVLSSEKAQISLFLNRGSGPIRNGKWAIYVYVLGINYNCRNYFVVISRFSKGKPDWTESVIWRGS